MTTMLPMNAPARIAKRVVFQCGCMCEYQIIGQFASHKDWHIIPCNDCSKDRVAGELERRAEETWEAEAARAKSLRVP